MSKNQLDWISEETYVESQKRLIDVLPGYVLNSDRENIYHMDSEGNILLEKRKNYGGFSYYRTSNFNERFGVKVPAGNLTAQAFKSDVVDDNPTNTKTLVETSTGKRYWADKKQMAEIEKIAAEARQARIDHIYLMQEIKNG